MTGPRSRRRLLYGLGGVGTAGLLAGCSDGSTRGDDTEPADGTEQVTEESTDDATNEDGEDDEDDEDGSEAGDGEELDLAEANVVDVAIEPAGPEDAYEFAVTLPHARQPFTRSATIEVGSASCVVVRGHDQTHGFGGRAVLFDLDSEAAESIAQGTAPRPFNSTDCPGE
ncbi:hypothetical protein BRC62_07945 [Halobacteriales archaeon QH_10_67_13]|nr:MAG: hypothetical protein BRC62_07945 [Halobacteriales archaeon QH_10_67_13]